MYIKLFLFYQAQSQALRGRRPPGPPIAKSAPVPPPSDYVDDSDSDDNSVRASLAERSEACVMLNDALVEPFVGGATLGLANCGGTKSGGTMFGSADAEAGLDDFAVAVGTNLCGTNDVYNEETYELDGGEMVVKRATVYAVRPVGVPSAEPIATNSEAADLSHIQPIVDKLPSSLTPDQRERAIELIKRNADVFSRSEYDVGCTDFLTARIVTDDHRPITEPLRRHARAYLDVIDETVDRMCQAGIAEPACSPWSANLVVVAKKR